MDTHTDPRTGADNTRPDLEPAARTVARLLPAIADEQLDGPTPCPDYTVRDLLAHVAGLAAAFRDAAKKDLGPGTDTPPDATRPVLGADWRSVLPRQLDEVAAAWRDPAAWEGETRAGGVKLPGAIAGRVALNELVIHGWDLACSTGQAYDADRASLGVSYGLLQPADALGRGTAFGPAVEVPDDASFVDRVIGLSGRSPQWKP